MLTQSTVQVQVLKPFLGWVTKPYDLNLVMGPKGLQMLLYSRGEDIEIDTDT